jgi:hypothetical protein
VKHDVDAGLILNITRGTPVQYWKVEGPWDVARWDHERLRVRFMKCRCGFEAAGSDYEFLRSAWLEHLPHPKRRRWWHRTRNVPNVPMRDTLG